MEERNSKSIHELHCDPMWLIGAIDNAVGLNNHNVV